MLGTSRVIACVLASALVAGPVLAQPKAPSDKDKQRAGDLVKQAIAKSQAGEHETAVTLYLDAYEIVPLPILLSNVGNEYQQAKKPVEALRYFCMYLDKDPTGTNASFATAQAKVLQIQLGNRVDDDRKVCDKPAPVPTEPTTGAGATGTGDGGTSATDTPAVGEVGPGVVEHPAHDAAPDDPGKKLKTAGLVTAGVGVLGLGLGVVFGVKAKTISDVISDQDPTMMWRPDIKDYEARGQRYENYQIVGLVAGGALIAGGVGLYLFGRSKTAAAEKLSLAPTVTRTSAGLAVTGAF